jgi:hypothetical protein
VLVRSVCLVFVLLLFGACGDDDGPSSRGDQSEGEEQSDDEDQSEDESAEVEQPFEEVEQDPVVTLLDRGDEPREELRYALEAGTEFEYEQTIRLEQEYAGQSIGPITSTSSYTAVVESVEDGIAELSVDYGEATAEGGPGVPPEVVTATQEGLDTIVGLEVDVHVDDRGAVLDARTDTNGSSDALGAVIDQAVSSFVQLSTPLPEEAVGVGSRWSVEQNFEASGITTVLTQELTLVDVTGDEISLDLTQVVEGGGGGASTSGSGSGTTRLDLTAPLGEGATTAESRVEAQGDTIIQYLDSRVERR